MQPDPATGRPEVPPDTGPLSEAAPATAKATTTTTAFDRLWPWALVGGLLAGLASWLGGETVHGYFEVEFVKPANWTEINPYERSSVQNRQILMKRPAAEAKNAAMAYGMLGAALGAALGLAGGLARRDVRAALIAGGVGLLAGSAAGAGLSAAMVIGIFYPNLNPETGLLMPLIVHGAVWASIGIAAGLAFGLGQGDRRLVGRAMVGGLVGAVAGTIAFELISATAFALERVEAPIPSDRLARLAAHLCVAVFTALGAAYGLRERRPTKERAPAPEIA